MVDVVKYIGLGDVRRISEKDWKAVGIEGQESVQWDRSNGFSVPVDKLGDEALVTLAADREFTLPKSLRDVSGETDSDVLPTGERTPSGATTTATSSQPSSTRGSRSGGKGGPSS